MSRHPKLARLSFAILLGVPACTPAPPAGPALILTGGRIYATPATSTPVGALAISGDSVLALGSAVEIRALAGDSTQEMALQGATVLPGLHDAWVDLEGIGRWNSGFDLRGAATPREVQARLREAAAVSADWIVGWGWDESIWPRPELPDHGVLDAVVVDRPVLLWHRTGRLAWLNAAAMLASGLDVGPRAGLGMTSGGDWNGIAYGPALQALRDALPASDRTDRHQWIAAGARAAAAAGYTSVTTSPIDAQAVGILQRLETDGDLGIRVEIRVRPAAAKTLAGFADSQLLRAGGIGVEIDGPFGPRLASLLQPYADGGDSGPEVDQAAIDAACAAAARSDLRLDVQVHGDAALRAALTCDPVAQGKGLVIGADMPAQLLSDAAPPVAVAATPQRLAHDLYFLEQRLGPRRAATTHPLRDLLVAGHLVAFTSLAPRYSLAPMAAAWVSWRRQDLEGYPLDGWVAPQRIGVHDALGVQVAAGWSQSPPALTAGDRADLVVWSADPFEDSEKSLPQAQAMVTLVAGRVTYSRPLVQPDFDSRE